MSAILLRRAVGCDPAAEDRQEQKHVTPTKPQHAQRMMAQLGKEINDHGRAGGIACHRFECLPLQ